jgi:hypothetical protein
MKRVWIIDDVDSRGKPHGHYELVADPDAIASNAALRPQIESRRATLAMLAQQRRAGLSKLETCAARPRCDSVLIDTAFERVSYNGPGVATIALSADIGFDPSSGPATLAFYQWDPGAELNPDATRLSQVDAVTGASEQVIGTDLVWYAANRAGPYWNAVILATYCSAQCVALRHVADANELADKAR